MKVVERGRNDWIVVLIILIIGFLCVLAAGQLALRFVPRWQLNTNMDSQLDPNSDFLTRRPDGFIEAIDASILTQPSWIDVFLTPGASFVTGTPFPAVTRTSAPSPTTAALATSTAIVAISPTNTFVYFPPTGTATRRPASTTTPVLTQPTSAPVTLTSTSISVLTATPTVTSSPTATGSSTTTATSTATATATATPTFTPIPIPTDPMPGLIGTTPDGVAYPLASGGTLTLGINIVANGNPGYDLVYYEFPAGSGVWLDWAVVQISDGTNWYTIFNWGDNIADTNTNMNFNILSNPIVPPEQDQRDIPSAELYNSTGIAIDIDAVVPPGTYPYIRFTAPTGDIDGQMEIDAIQLLP